MCGVDHQPLSSVEVKERVELHIYSPSGPTWPIQELTLPYDYNLRVTGLLQYFYAPRFCTVLVRPLLYGVCVFISSLKSEGILER